MAAEITAAIGEKGGDAKSTTIQNLAVQLTLRSRRVLIGDLDPQGTTRKWGQRRREDKTEPEIDVFEVSPRQLESFLNKHAGAYDHILLDTGGADSDGMRLSLMHADTALVPCAPSQADIETLENVNRLLGRANDERARDKKSNMRALLFATMVTAHASAELEEMRAFCAGFTHLHLLETAIGFRKVFKHALRDGLGVVEYSPGEFTRKAIEECLALEKEVFGL